MLQDSVIYLDGDSLTVDQVALIARSKKVSVRLAESVLPKILESSKWVERAVSDGRVIYGVSTGFGMFKNKILPTEALSELQTNLIRSHSCGVGVPLSEEAVRAAIVIRINSLIKGFSGIRQETVDFLLDLLNKGIYPFVPEQGSVGSSGDLAPLSHIMLLMLGEGECIVDGVRKPSKEVLAAHGVITLVLAPKEGLALINGTSVQTGIAALATFDAAVLIDSADIAASMSVEVLMGSEVPFFAPIQQVRNQIGQIAVGQNIAALLHESDIVHSHKGCGRVQDAYSLRCIPQVHGAIRDAFTYASSVVSRELNAVTDNPLIFLDQDCACSGGNFHGEPIAIAMDTLGIALAELANISERRIAKMVDPATNEGLPAFLIKAEFGGLHSGMMIPQYAAAALVSENKVLAHPASVDSIPTSANQEDHVSMGTIAARKAFQIVKNVRSVIAIELLCAAQGYEFRRPLRLSPATQAVYSRIREDVATLSEDRALYVDIEKIAALLQDKEIVTIVSAMISEWNYALNCTSEKF